MTLTAEEAKERVRKALANHPGRPRACSKCVERICERGRRQPAAEPQGMDPVDFFARFSGPTPNGRNGSLFD